MTPVNKKKSRVAAGKANKRSLAQIPLRPTQVRVPEVATGKERKRKGRHRRPTKGSRSGTKKVELNLPPISDLRIKNAMTVHLAAVGHDLRQLGRRYREEQRLGVAKVYALACVLREDPDVWLEFCRDPFWGKRGPKDNHRPLALRFALKMVCGAGRAAQQRASKYWTALKVWFEEEVPADEIPDRVKRAGGWQKCASRNAVSKMPVDRPKKSNRAGGVASSEKEASSNSASPTALATRVSAAKDLPIVNVKFARIFIRKLAKAKCNGTATIVVDIIAVDENRIVVRARKVTC